MGDDDAGIPRPPQPQIPMAIVGYSHRLPGGLRTDDDFWRLLSEREIVQEPVTDRYGRGYRPVGGFSGPGRFASPWEGLIREDRERLFDRSLFGMSHNEMLATDPQLRMLLSCAWEAIERTGWDLRSLRNSSTGVFIGGQLPAVANWRPMRGVNEFAVTSISLAMLANRISYHFNLKGPSTTYCTACSASLTALHAAMNALQSGDCEQAVVGSVNYLGSSRLSVSFNALGVISPDGKCHSFDAEANGYMRSEGAFVFAVKPLAAAERDGDHVHAVVEATAVNAAGAADGSGGLAPGRYITAPTRHAQVDLMRTARVRAGRSRQDFDYIEAHATGTVVGDRIEGNAITEAYGGVEREIPLRVSSVKSNVGHMEAAAFHCALLKVVLMMRHRTFAPTSRNFLVPNPEIDFDGCPMQVQTACEPFPDRPVVVGVNSFGFGGANGHCVVREYRPARPRVWSVPPATAGGVMIPLSARSPDALTRSARELRDWLDEHDCDLHMLAGNLGRRRTHFASRAAFAVRSRQELSDALDAFAEDPAPIATVDEGRKRVAMVFSGQGTQWAGCGRDLYDADPVFRRVVDAVEAHWRTHSDISLRDACFRARQDELDEVQLAQPVIFMVECALVELLKTWGVYPDCVIGHSSGEVAAAYACGALSLRDATRLVFHRATLQQRTAGSGRMLAVGLDRPGVEELLDELNILAEPGGDPAREVEIACVNAPANTVVCGRRESLEPVIAELDRRHLQSVLLPGNIAFHSAAMDPIGDDVLAALSFLDDRPFDADAAFISSVTGEATDRLDAAYWWSNVRRPVSFAAAMETALRQYRPDVVLEVAPHCALQPAIAQCLEATVRAPVCVPTLTRDSRRVPRLSGGPGRPLQGRGGARLRGAVSAAEARRPPASRPSPGRADGDGPLVRRRDVRPTGRVLARPARGPPRSRRAHAVRGPALRPGLPVAGGPSRPSRRDHAGGRLHRARPGGPRRCSRSPRGDRVPAALPRPRDAGAAADGLAPGGRRRGRLHLHDLVEVVRVGVEERGAQPRQRARGAGRPRPGRAAQAGGHRHRRLRTVVARGRPGLLRAPGGGPQRDLPVRSLLQDRPARQGGRRDSGLSVRRGDGRGIVGDGPGGRLRRITPAVGRGPADIPLQPAGRGGPLRHTATRGGSDVSSRALRPAGHLSRHEAA